MTLVTSAEQVLIYDEDRISLRRLCTAGCVGARVDNKKVDSCCVGLWMLLEMVNSCCKAVVFNALQEGDGGVSWATVGVEAESRPRSKIAIVGIKRTSKRLRRTYGQAWVENTGIFKRNKSKIMGRTTGIVQTNSKGQQCALF
jgi:hypothetical protein